MENWYYKKVGLRGTGRRIVVDIGIIAGDGVDEGGVNSALPLGWGLSCIFVISNWGKGGLLIEIYYIFQQVTNLFDML